MVGHPTKSACYLVLAFTMLGLSGCASDGGLGELAIVAAMVAPIPGDASALLATAAVAGGAVALASASSTDPTPGVVPVPEQTAAYKPDLQVLVTRETPERYRSRSCEYIEMAMSAVPSLCCSKPVRRAKWRPARSGMKRAVPKQIGRAGLLACIWIRLTPSVPHGLRHRRRAY